MASKLKGLITEHDKRAFLREMYEESVVESTKKKIESFSNEEYFGGICPYCHKMSVFGNKGKQRYGDKEFVIANCEGAPPHIIGCGRDILIKVKVNQEGDILSGYKFTPLYDFFTVEEIESKYGSPEIIDLDEDVKKEHEQARRLREEEAERYRKTHETKINKHEPADVDGAISLKRFVIK